MNLQDIIFIVLGIAVGGGVMWWLSQKNSKQAGASSEEEEVKLAQHLHAFNESITNQLHRVTEQLDKRLHENSKSVQDQVSSAQRSVQQVSASLGKLTQLTGDMQPKLEEITSFQKLLKAPKVRGSFGEVLLGNLLADVLPKDRYALQATMSSGEIADAVIKLQDNYIVAVDAKFPLANYEIFAREENLEKKRALRSQVLRDIKKHIGDISKKYVLPQDRTLDYAFMYIPVEGVYYETMVRGDEEQSLWDFCLQNHVVPVSPNSFLAYLHTVLVGLRGMQVEKQAQEILAHLSQVRKDFRTFAEDFTTVGKHLGNAKNRFDDSARRLDKFSNRLEQIETGEPQAKLEE